MLEGAPLTDGRAEAGIGRYASSLTAALSALPAEAGIEVRTARPRHRSPTERRPLRWLRGQPSIALAGVGGHAGLVHALSGEPSLVWPPGRQVVTVHDVLGLRSPMHRRGRAAVAYGELTGRLVRRCAAVITVSPCVAAEVGAELGIDPARFHIVPLGVSGAFSAVPRPDDPDRRRGMGLEPGARYVLWTGSLVAHDPRKALDILLEAMAACRRGLGDDHGLTLVVAGRGGPEGTRVAGVAGRLRVPLLAAGWVSDSDLAALLRGAVAAVVPSLHEGFGLPALEAMACGAPLVVSRAGNLPDLVGEAALLCEPADPAALAEALTRVVVPRSEAAARLRRAGPARAAGYTWERAADLTAAVYRRAAGGA